MRCHRLFGDGGVGILGIGKGLASYYIPRSMGERDKEHFQQSLNTQGSDKCKSLMLCTTRVMGLQQLLLGRKKAQSG